MSSRIVSAGALAGVGGHCVIGLAMLALASQAHAADNALFPTDVLVQGRMAADVSYGYSYYKTDTSGVLNAKIKSESNKINGAFTVGLGYGLHAGIQADYYLNNRTALSVGMQNSTIKHKGISNPMVAVRWNPLETFWEPNGWGLAIEYGYKTATLGDNNSPEYGYDMHRVSVTGSFDAGPTRLYAGYTGDLRGKVNGADAGNTNYVALGAKYTINKDVDVNIGSLLGLWGKSSRTGSYVTSDTGASAEIQVFNNLWLIPQISANWTDNVTVTSSDGRNAVIKSAVGFTASGAMRFLF